MERIDPINFADTPEDDSAPCGCGSQTCRIDGNDASNVLVDGLWYAESCVEHCGDQDCGKPVRQGTLVRVNWKLAVCGECARQIADLLTGREFERIADERAGK